MRFTPISHDDDDDDDGEYPYDDLIHATCLRLFSIFRMKEASPSSSTAAASTSSPWWRELEGLLIWGFAVPLLAISTLVYLQPRNSKSIWRGGVGFGGGDWNIQVWTFLFVGLPCLLVTFVPLFTTPNEIWRHIRERHGHEHAWQPRLALFAAVTGDAAVVALGLFLVPVAKHSPLLQVFGLSFSQALVFHRLAGWISLVVTILHGSLYLVDYGTGFWLLGGSLKDEEHTHSMGSFVSNIWREIRPPTRCWTWDMFLYHSNDWGTMQENNDKTASRHGHYGCNPYFFNFTGFMSMLAFVIMAACSLPWVRRKAYWLFYTVHIPMAWIMLLGDMAHITYISLYLVPGIIYYMAPTVSVWIQQWYSANRYGGVQLVSVTRLANANDCFVVRLRTSYNTVADSHKAEHEGEEQDEGGLKLGGVCKICVPQISSIWHPFSTMIQQQQQQNGGALLHFLVRPTGPFTKEWLSELFMTEQQQQQQVQEEYDEESSRRRRLEQVPLLSDWHCRPTNSTPPIILVDGIYPAEYRWHECSLYQHDSMLLVAGGVGIVPFLPLLQELVVDTQQLWSTHTRRRPLVQLERVTLHWYCREEGLVSFVCQEYLSWFLQDATILLENNDSSTRSEEKEEPSNNSGPTTRVVHAEDSTEEVVGTAEEDGTCQVVEATTPVVSFNLCIHVTSRRPSQDQEDESLNHLLLRRNDGPTTIQDVTVKFPEDVGTSSTTTAHTQAYVSISNQWGQNWMTLVWFGALVTIGGVLSWELYKVETIPGRGHSLLIRVHVVLLVLVVSACFGVGLVGWGTRTRTKKNYEFLHGEESSSPPTQHPEEEEQDSPSVVLSSPTETVRLTSTRTPTVRVQKRAHVTSGRPAVDDVIQSVMDAKSPGATFCGPQPLRDALKSAIRKGQKASTSSSSCCCAFYDEQSDL